MIAYIDQHKDRYGVEPICRVLPIAPSTYYQHTKGPRSARAVCDAQLKVEIARVHAEHFGVYGARKGVAAAAPRGDRGGPLHGGAADG
jgi:putative transposase